MSFHFLDLGPQLQAGCGLGRRLPLEASHLTSLVKMFDTWMQFNQLNSYAVTPKAKG